MTIMKQWILPHVESSLRDIQDQILAARDVEEEEIEEAVNTYIANGDKDLAGIVKTIRSIYRQFGGI